MNTLFIAYNGALEPVMQSQGIPYLKALSRKGVNITILTFEKNNSFRSFIKERDKYAKVESYRAKMNELVGELQSFGIKWYRLRYHKYPSLPATLFDIFQGIVLGGFIILKQKINIIHSRGAVPAAMGYMLSKIFRKKFIFDERGLMAEEYVDGGMWKRNSFTYRLVLYFEKKFLCKADALLVLSNKIKDFLKDSGYIKNGNSDKKDKIKVIPCCVDLDRFRPMDAAGLRQKYNFKDKFVFLYTGSLGTWYLIDEMLDFFVYAKGIVPNVHFLFLVHTGEEIGRRSCAKRNISLNDVTITSAEPRNVPEYISMADAGIFFIKPCLSKKSSCPIKFAEYIACGLPVLINRGIGDTDEIVEQNRIGIVIDRFNREDYVKGFSDLLKLKSENDAVLKERCRAVGERIFSLDKGVSLYLDIYNKVFSGK